MAHTRAHKLAIGVLLAAAATLVPVAAVDATPAPKYQLVVNDDFSSGSIEFVVETVPPVVEAGIYKVGFANNSVAPHVLVAVGGLPEGITLAEFEALVLSVESGQSPPPESAFLAGAIFVKPGQDHQKQFDVSQPGQYGYFCPIQGPDGTYHFQEGFIGLYQVVSD